VGRAVAVESEGEMGACLRCGGCVAAGRARFACRWNWCRVRSWSDCLRLLLAFQGLIP
jgi:hypothetical protein